MSRQNRQVRRNKREVYVEEVIPDRVVRRNNIPLEPKTPAQKRYISAIRNSVVTFGVGPAGTGKTYIAGSIAAELLNSRSIETLYITRPVIEAGEKLGFLPGEMDEKYAPYIAALRQVLDERLGSSTVDFLLKSGRIQAVPLGYMRGLTFKNCMVIFDEAQNATKEQFKLFLTRIGENCRVVVDGDPSQSDIPNSGLLDAINRVSYIPSIRVVEFDKSDSVRSGLTEEILTAYES